MYIIIYLAKGSLPWQGIVVQLGQIHQNEVLRVKQATIVKALCKGLPQPFIEFVKHIRCLGFQDKPNYKFLHSILEKCALPHMPPNSQSNASSIRCSQVVICA